MKYLLAFSFLVSSLNVFGFGLGDWQHDTPGGNAMGDPGNGIHLTFYGKAPELTGIKRWYFYHDFVIGELYDGQFIVDERTGEKKIFKDSGQWTKEIQSRGLEPFLWTRWYEGNWVDGDWITIWLFFGFIVSIPLALFFVYALYRAVVKERFRLTSLYTVFVLSVTGVAGITLLLDSYPSSI